MAEAEGVQRSSIPVDGEEIGSNSSLEASTEREQWGTDQIGRSSKMVEGQTRTGEGGPGSAGMGGNWMGSSFRDGFSSLCLLLVDPVSCLPASRPFPQTGPLTRPVSIPLSELIMALTRRLQRMGRLREEIVAVGKSVGGGVPV